MTKILRLSHQEDQAWRRLGLVFALLIGLALACSAGQEPDQQQATTAPAIEGTQNPLYLPEVQSGGSQGSGEPAGGQPAPNTLYLPQVSSGSGQRSDSPLQLEASASTLKAGENVTVSARAPGTGQITFTLIIQDAGTAEGKPLARVNSANEAQTQEGASQVLEILSAEGNSETATFVLRAKGKGTATVNVFGSGELQGDSGTNTWSGTGSQPITITVTD